MLIVLLQVTVYDMYVVVPLKIMWRRLNLLYDVNGQVDGDCKFYCCICVSIYTYIYIYTHTHTYIIFIYLYTLCKQLIVRVLGIFKTNSG